MAVASRRYPDAAGSDRHRGSPRGDRSRPGQGRDERGGDYPAAANVWIGGLPSDITEREIERVCTKFGPVHKVTIKHSQVDTYVFVNYGHASHARDAISQLDQTDPFSTGTIKVAPASKKTASGNEASDRGGQKWSDSRANGTREYRRGDWGGRSDYPDRHAGGGGGAAGRDRSPRRRSRSRNNSRGGDRERDRNRDRDRGRDRPWSKPRRSPAWTKPQAPRPVRVYLSQLPRDMEEDELQEIAAEYGKVLAHELHREGAYKCGWVEYASKSEAEAAVGELDDRRMDDWTMRLQAYLYPGGGA